MYIPTTVCLSRCLPVTLFACHLLIQPGLSSPGISNALREFDEPCPGCFDCTQKLAVLCNQCPTSYTPSAHAGHAAAGQHRAPPWHALALLKSCLRALLLTVGHPGNFVNLAWSGWSCWCRRTSSSALASCVPVKTSAPCSARASCLAAHACSGTTAS
eukprot:1160578-Pelagomonas_calceolata.AAC.6